MRWGTLLAGGAIGAGAVWVLLRKRTPPPPPDDETCLSMEQALVAWDERVPVRNHGRIAAPSGAWACYAPALRDGMLEIRPIDCSYSQGDALDLYPTIG